jgi:hypothetical protein
MAQQGGFKPASFSSSERGTAKFRYFTASEMDSVAGEALWQGRPNQSAAQQPHRNC